MIFHHRRFLLPLDPQTHMEDVDPLAGLAGNLLVLRTSTAFLRSFCDKYREKHRSAA